MCAAVAKMPVTKRAGASGDESEQQWVVEVGGARCVVLRWYAGLVLIMTAGQDSRAT